MKPRVGTHCVVVTACVVVDKVNVSITAYGGDPSAAAPTALDSLSYPSYVVDGDHLEELLTRIVLAAHRYVHKI